MAALLCLCVAQRCVAAPFVVDVSGDWANGMCPHTLPALHHFASASSDFFPIRSRTGPTFNPPGTPGASDTLTIPDGMFVTSAISRSLAGLTMGGGGDGTGAALTLTGSAALSIGASGLTIAGASVNVTLG